MKKIAVVGSINMDFVTSVQMQPKVGETVLGNGMELKPGGKGANQAYAAAYLGGDVTMLGAVGDDDSGKRLIENLKKVGVHTEYIKVSEGVSSGVAWIAVNEAGDNSIIVIPGANQTVDRAYVDSVMDVIRESDIVILQLEIPMDTVEYVAKKAKEAGKYVILDPAPAQRLGEDLLNGLSIVKPNETEVMEILGEVHKDGDPEEKLRVMKEYGVETPIVTLGSKGSCMLDEMGSIVSIPALKVKAVDTTGAGDCFTGAMAYAISTGKDLKEALVFASAASAYSVMHSGAQTSFPSREQAESMLEV